jgi:arsenate reductase (thioredoxin)
MTTSTNRALSLRSQRRTLPKGPRMVPSTCQRKARALSGGSEPADTINPMAIEAMAEVGIDITRETQKRWTNESLAAADVVITMGCGDTCSIVPGTRYEDWPLEDPAGKDLSTVRRIRDEIKHRVEQLLARLDAHA